MGTLELSLKAIEDGLLDGALQYEYASAVYGAPDGSSEGTPTFEIEIKGALEVCN